MPKRWTINSAAGRDRSYLVGCHIIETDDGKYQFTGPSPDNILATTDQRTVPFDFPLLIWAPPGRLQFTWMIRVWTLTGGASGTQAEGRWSNTDPGNPSPDQDESGTWTAQAGATLEEESEGDAAAAAGGGSNV